MDHCLDGKVDDVEGFQKYLDLLGVEYLNVESYKKVICLHVY